MHQRQTVSRLLRTASARPERLAAGFTAFGRFSLRNQVLAVIQCEARGLEPSPLATAAGWAARGAEVRRGERPISLCRRDPSTACAETAPRLHFEPLWYLQSQTTIGAQPATSHQRAAWSAADALTRLHVRRLAFSPVGEGDRGYSFKRFLAIHPKAEYPEKVLFHELAHILLGHSEVAERRYRAGVPEEPEEVMAEAVAMLVAGAISARGVAETAAVLDGVFAQKELDESSAWRVFEVADEILAAVH